MLKNIIYFFVFQVNIGVRKIDSSEVKWFYSFSKGSVLDHSGESLGCSYNLRLPHPQDMTYPQLNSSDILRYPRKRSYLKAWSISITSFNRLERCRVIKVIMPTGIWIWLTSPPNKKNFTFKIWLRRYRKHGRQCHE